MNQPNRRNHRLHPPPSQDRAEFAPRSHHSVCRVSFSYEELEVEGLEDEWGLGKSMTALATLELRPPIAREEGKPSRASYGFAANNWRYQASALIDMFRSIIQQVDVKPATERSELQS